jgi:DnaJ-class molecular chaperone
LYAVLNNNVREVREVLYMRATLKKINNFLLKDRSKPIPNTHKICPSCEGSGYEDLFTVCPTCEREGIIRKSYVEFVESLGS